MRAIVLGSVAALCLISVGGEIAAQDAVTGCLQKNGKLDQVALGENPRGGACKGKSSQVKLQILSPGKTVHRVGEYFSTEQWMTTPATGELEQVFVELARIGGFTLSVHLWRSVNHIGCDLLVTHETEHFGGSVIGDGPSAGDNPWNLESVAFPGELLWVVRLHHETDIANRMELHNHQNSSARKDAGGSIFQAANREALRFLTRYAASLLPKKTSGPCRRTVSSAPRWSTTKILRSIIRESNNVCYNPLITHRIMCNMTATRGLKRTGPFSLAAA